VAVRSSRPVRAMEQVIMSLMKARKQIHRTILLVTLMIALAGSSARLRADTGTCGGATLTLPFSDVPSSNIFFCSIAEAYFSALTNGTSPMTYSPAANVPREQMAAFVTRTMDQSLTRGSRRAALDQYWTTQEGDSTFAFTNGDFPALIQSDGADLWVANTASDRVARIRTSDGKVLDRWTGVAGAFGVLCAMGRVFVTGATNPGGLYEIDPTQPGHQLPALSNALGATPHGIGYDGMRIWTANLGGSVSIITLDPTSVNNVSTEFTSPYGVIYDGTNIWVTDAISGSPGKLQKLDSSGAIVLSVDVGHDPRYPAFDGTNIWVPNYGSDTMSIVRASTGALIATLAGNGLHNPNSVAFDGERMLVTQGNTISLWKAVDLSFIGTFPTFATSSGACSDGLGFWVAVTAFGLQNFGDSWLARF